MSTKKIVLTSSDGESFEVEEAVALQSQTLADLIKECGTTTTKAIPVTNVSSNILGLVIEYCKKHAQAGSSSDDLKKWDAEFMSEFEQPTIYGIMLASNYLNIPSLLDLTCQTIADMIAACKDEAEIRAKFDIVSDFAPGEVENIRHENQRAFQ